MNKTTRYIILLIIALAAGYTFATIVSGAPIKNVTSCTLFLGSGHGDINVFVYSDVKSKTALQIFARKTDQALRKFAFFKGYKWDYYIEKEKGACKGTWKDVEIGIGDFFPTPFKNEVNLGAAPGYKDQPGSIFVSTNFKFRDETLLVHEFGHAFNLNHDFGSGNIMDYHGARDHFDAYQLEIMRKFIAEGR